MSAADDTTPTVQQAAARIIDRDLALVYGGGGDLFSLARPIAAHLAREGLLRTDVGPETSDGIHTFAELYTYRMLYHAHAANLWAEHGTYPVVKSWRHHDGEECFGGGWFIVVAALPDGQASNHYPAADWDRFQVPAVLTAPLWDGHTPEVAAERLRAALAAPVRLPCGHCGRCQDERAAGWASGKLLLVVARRAAARGDAHELLHCRAALEAGDSGHPVDECPNDDVLRFAHAELRRRGELPATPLAALAPHQAYHHNDCLCGWELPDCTDDECECWNADHPEWNEKYAAHQLAALAEAGYRVVAA